MATTTSTTKATTVKKTTTATKKPTVAKVEDKSEIESLKEQIAYLTQVIGNMSSGGTTSTDNEKYTSDDEIAVISQCVGQLTLATGGMGIGTLYEFPEFGYILDIPFGDLKDIVNKNGASLERGDFYIVDEKAVKQLRLQSRYQRMLSNEDIMTLFDRDADNVVDLYKLAPEAQKENIINMVLDKIYNGEDIDKNILSKLSEVCGRNLLEVEKL